MGPNRQPRPQDSQRNAAPGGGGRGGGRGGGGGRGRGGRRGGGHHHHHPTASHAADAAIASHSRDMIIDVLRHVATGGSVDLTSRHFDPAQRNKNTITFHKFGKGTSGLQVLANVLGDKAFGFPSQLVELFAASCGERSPGLDTSIKCSADVFEQHQPLLKAALWDLAHLMVDVQLTDAQRSEAELAEQQFNAVVNNHDDDGDEEAEEIQQQRQQLEEELGYCLSLFSDEIVLCVVDGGESEEAFRCPDKFDPDYLSELPNNKAEPSSSLNTTTAADSNDDDGSGDAPLAVVRAVFQAKDHGDVQVILRVPYGYPSPGYFPLVVVEPKEATAAATTTTVGGKKADKNAAASSSQAMACDALQSGMTLTSVSAMRVEARRTILDAAASAIVENWGSNSILSLLQNLRDTIQGCNVKPPVVTAPTEKELDAARSKQQATLQSAEKERRRFVNEVLLSKTSTTTAASSAEGDDAPVVQLPAKVALATVDTQGSGATSSSGLGANLDGPKVPGLGRQKPDVDAALRAEWAALQSKGSLQKVRNNLPAFKIRDELRAALRSHNVIVVGGETGSGKTTQVPQFLLEYMIEEGRGSLANIVCTQPRRLAATAVALRVAEERDEEISGTVGYSIRLENRLSAKTRLLYCTTGIILRRLQTDKALSNVSHIVVDEIHERGVDTDFLLILLKDLLTRRSDLKVVLMSATMNSDLFSKYFDNAPVLSIAGRTHPVEVIPLECILPMVGYVLDDYSPYAKRQDRGKDQSRRDQGRKTISAVDSEVTSGRLDAELVQGEDQEKKRLLRQLRLAESPAKEISDQTLSIMTRLDPDVINYELIERIVTHVCSKQYAHMDGAVLVFLPGLAEILRAMEELQSSESLRGKVVIYNLHSSLGSSEQQQVFKRAPHGKRKVVLGTNIMETSITIDDAVFVIDCGKHKENQYDARKSLSKLVTTTISKANCRQRRGRAGRVMPGVCFTLFSTAQFASFDDHQLCEMHRVPLESLILQIYMLGLGDEMEYLRKALSPPEEKAVRASVKVLTTLGALTEQKRLTSLGAHLAGLPLDVKIGKMIIHGAVLHCLDPVLTIAAVLTVKSPFSADPELQSEVFAVRRAYAAGTCSDQVAAWNAYRKWLSITAGKPLAESRRFCQANYLNLQALQQIQAMKQQYERYLVEAGFVELAEGKKRPHRTNFMFEPYRTLDDDLYESGGAAYNVNSNVSKCIVACLAAGLYPNVAKIHVKRKQQHPPTHHSSGGGGARLQGHMEINTFDGSRVVIHPSSVTSKESQFPYPLLLYTDKVQTSMIFLREVTMLSPLHVILFSSGEMSYKPVYGELVVDNVTAFRCREDEAALFMHLKDQFDSALRQKINDPGMSWETTSSTVVKAIVTLLRDEGGASKALQVIVNPMQVPLSEKQQQAAADAAVGIAPPAPPPSSSGGGGGGSTSNNNNNNNNAAAAAGASSYEPPLSSKAAYRLSLKQCFNCGEKGHISRQCPKPPPPRNPGAPTVRCFICGVWHHPCYCPMTKGGAEAEAKRLEAGTAATN